MGDLIKKWVPHYIPANFHTEKLETPRFLERRLKNETSSRSRDYIKVFEKGTDENSLLKCAFVHLTSISLDFFKENQLVDDNFYEFHEISEEEFNEHALKTFKDIIND